MEYYGIGKMAGMQPMPTFGGLKLASQVTAMIQLGMSPGVTIAERRREMNPCAPLGSDEQLNIAAGDIVMTPREMTNDNNPFSVFNGLKKEDVEKYMQKYRFAGIALDAFPVASGTLAPTGIDLQIGGIASWMNVTGKTVMPGTPLTWMPNIDGLLPEEYKRSSTKIGSAVSPIIKAIAVPFSPSEATLNKILGLRSTDVLTTDIITNALPIIMEQVIGINQTVVQDGAIGQFALVR